MAGIYNTASAEPQSQSLSRVPGLSPVTISPVPAVGPVVLPGDRRSQGSLTRVNCERFHHGRMTWVAGTNAGAVAGPRERTWWQFHKAGWVS